MLKTGNSPDMAPIIKPTEGDVGPALLPAPMLADPTLKQILRVLLGTVIVGALYLGREFLMPLTLAVILAFILAPLVQALRRARLPRVIAVFTAVLLSLAIVSVAGVLIGSQLGALVEDVPQYQGTLEAKFGQVGTYTTNELSALTARLGVRPEQTANRGKRVTRLAKNLNATAAPTAIPVQIYQPPLKPWELARRIAGPVLAPLATAGLVFVVAIFILLQQADLRDRLIRLVGSSDLHRTTLALDDAAARLSRYFLSQLAVNAAFGATIAVGLHFIGVPHAALFGGLSAVARYIPYVGIFVSAGLSATMAAAVDPGWTLVFWTIALFVAADTLTGQVIEPLFYGHSTGLSPVSVIVAAVFWTWLWGPIGLVLSTPLSLVLLVLGRHVPQLEFIDVLLGDRPPLTEVEICYQRLLAGNAGEATHQAGELLRDRSLSAYYDQVALKAMVLAASDEHLGTMSRAQLMGVRATATRLVESLADRPDREVGPARRGWRGLLWKPKQPPQTPLASAPGSRNLSVLCLSGPGPLDEVASAMLVQILQKQGFTTATASYDTASAQRIGELKLADYGVICVTAVQVERASLKLGRLIARLAERATGAPIVLTMICASDRSEEIKKLGYKALPAPTIRAAVDLCVVATIE